MAELAHFKNFAKLKDTSVEFNDITVLAGKPSTGKSYVMKFMYAINEAIFQYNKSILKIKEAEKSIYFLLGSDSPHSYETIDKYLKNEDYSTLEAMISDIYDSSGRIQSYLHSDISILFSKKNLNLLFFINNYLKSIFINHSQISGNYEVKYKDVIYKLKEENLKIQYIKSNFYQIEQPIFVETPLILEFKKFMNHEKGKTPYHIESLLNILDTNYLFTDREQDKFIKNFREKSQKIIGGDIESSGDSFIFNRKDDKNYDILNASSGIKSIGLLQYLVTNKALKKGSVLFWEEPEVHLHPSWQLKMVDLFVVLMNAGVEIVFSTHSPYMADYLNAISKKGDYRDRISFNVLDEKDGIVTNHILDDDNWDILQKELMDSFEDILWQYL